MQKEVIEQKCEKLNDITVFNGLQFFFQVAKKIQKYKNTKE